MKLRLYRALTLIVRFIQQHIPIAIIDDVESEEEEKQERVHSAT
jgi:hypothetical protein